MIKTDKYELYKGDCLEVIDKLIERGVKVDTILIDPPYELDNHGKGKNGFKDRKLVKENHIDYLSKGFDYEIVFSKLLEIQKTPNMIIFCSNNQVAKIMNFFEKKAKCTLLVWNKTNPIPLCNGKHVGDVEFIVYVRGKKAPFNNKLSIDKKYKVKRYPTVNTKRRLHPTEKPEGLIEELIELHSLEDQIVFDGYMGSGTTGAACLKTGRKFIGVEIKEEHFNNAKKRIEDTYKELNKEVC
ncbi:DNA-methyltransferase (plasmid) [Clostridium perfringens]